MNIDVKTLNKILANQLQKNFKGIICFNKWDFFLKFSNKKKKETSLLDKEYLQQPYS